MIAATGSFTFRRCSRHLCLTQKLPNTSESTTSLPEPQERIMGTTLATVRAVGVPLVTQTSKQ